MHQKDNILCVCRSYPFVAVYSKFFEAIRPYLNFFFFAHPVFPGLQSLWYFFVLLWSSVRAGGEANSVCS